MRNCDQPGCAEAATHHPQIHIPALGWPINMHEPASLIMGLKLCHYHCSQAPAQDLLGSPDDEKGIRGVVKIMTRWKVPPDFTRAYVTCVSIDSDEGRLFAEMNAKNPHKTQG